jgi:predicted ATPase
LRVKVTKGIFCVGKFDQFNDEPYHGVASTCRGLCSELFKLRDSYATKPLFDAIHSEIIEVVEKQLPLLFTILPELRGLLCSTSGEDNTKCSPDRSPSQNLENLKNRMNFALLRFFGVISRHIQPLVMVWDDIQFADQNSLSLMELLLTDSRHSKLMIIACYRSNEVGDSVTATLKALDEKQNLGNFKVTKISIGNLEENHTHQIVMDLLGMDEPCTADLASICHRKTAGNAFFLVSFMTLLYQEKMLEFSIGLMKWTWDERKIKDDTPATANVVDLIQHKLESLSSSQRMLLINASFLGPVFSRDVLWLVWNELSDASGEEIADLDALLESSVKNGIFETTQGRKYRFVHDKVRECAALFIDPNQLPSMRYRIGRTLLSALDDEESNNIFFVALNLLNQGSLPSTEEERIELAEMNLNAARNLIDLAGFDVALKHVESGLTLLPSESRWIKYYATSLEFCDLGAETCAVLGDINKMQNYCDEVLRYAKTADDKLRVYFLKIDNLLRQALFEDAIETGIAVLKDHNILFPQNLVRRKASAILGLRRSKMEAKSLCVDKLLVSDIITDPRQLGVARIMYKVCLLPLIVTRGFSFYAVR